MQYIFEHLEDLSHIVTTVTQNEEMVFRAAFVVVLFLCDSRAGGRFKNWMKETEGRGLFLKK
jgi:hypothetical protein